MLYTIKPDRFLKPVGFTKSLKNIYLTHRNRASMGQKGFKKRTAFLSKRAVCLFLLIEMPFFELQYQCFYVF